MPLLIPLLLELSLVIDDGTPKDVYADYAKSVDALGDKLPKWEDFVQLEEEAVAKAAEILDLGRQYLKYTADLAAAELKQAAAITAGNPNGNNPPVRTNPINADTASPTAASQILRPTAEVNIVVWSRRERGYVVPLRLGKVTLNVRNPTPEDAHLFNNDSGDLPKSLKNYNLRVKPAMEVNTDTNTGWIPDSSRIISSRYQRLPRGGEDCRARVSIVGESGGSEGWAAEYLGKGYWCGSCFRISTFGSGDGSFGGCLR